MNPDPIVFAMANPNPEVTPEEAAPYVRDHGDRPLRLPEPDQQRARLPGHLPRRARRARARDHRGDEDGRRARRSPASSPTTSCARTTSSRRVFNRDVAPAVAAAVAEEARAERARRTRSTRSASRRPTSCTSAPPDAPLSGPAASQPRGAGRRIFLTTTARQEAWMRVTVTGATGLIGTRLVARAARAAATR